MEEKRILVGITHGDFNGIGYELIIKTLMDSRILELCTPVVYGSPKVAAYHRKALNIENFSFNMIKRPEEALDKRANMINCLEEEIRVELGKLSEQAGESAVASLRMAATDLLEGKIHVLVTAPIHKQNIRSERFPYTGHTEYLENLSGSRGMMFMVSETLKVGFVTGHIPLSEVPGRITENLILEKIRIMDRTMREDFLVRRPRIAVLGLNPHAGDEGIIGKEEQEVIKPALQKAAGEGMMVLGPYAADGFFGSGDFRKYDAILSMYHDQGLAPFKAMVFNEGVNYTAGLPVIRTSPVHGTAFEIAGQDLASPDSFRTAIYMACDIFRNRELSKEILKDPLKKYDLAGESRDQSDT